MEQSHETASNTEEFRQRYTEELGDLLDSGLFEEEPLPPDPASMGLGDTTLEELNDQEISVVRDVLFKKLGVDPSDPEALKRTYISEAPEEATVPGEIGIKVFKTNRDGIFLQEMSYQDGKQRWVIGPDTNI